MSSSTNSFLRGQRKTDLLGLAETVGLKNTDGLKKTELEVALDEYLAENQSRFGTNPKAAPYYQSRARAIGSPVKKELPPAAEPKVNKRKAAKAAEQNMATTTATTTTADEEDSEPTSTALVSPSVTPGRALALTRHIPLPASPADVARVVDERAGALRERVVSLYEDSGLRDVTYTTRETLSTVTSIIFCINAFELYHLRKEVLPDRYAFTIPGFSPLGTPDYPVEVPDMFTLLSSSFWSPVLLWLMTSIFAPSFFGFYFNLSAAHQSTQRKRGQPVDNFVDPLIYSLAKAVITYVIYQQGVTFGGWINPVSVARINSAVYGGWKGVITGAFITGVASFYDAVLRK